MTTPSPWTLGSVTTRRSTWRPSIVRPTRPSCGMRRSAMSRSAMILMRETTPATIRFGTVVASVSTPSMRIRTRTRSSARRVGLGLEVDVGGAALGGLGDDRVDELDDRRVVGGLAQVDDLLELGARRVLLDRLGDRVLEAVHARDQRVDVLAPRRPPAGRRSRSSARCRRPRARSPGRPSRPAACARRRRRPAPRRSAWRRPRSAGWRPPCRP